MQASYLQDQRPSKHVKKSGQRNLFLSMPIVGRLLLGFFIPAVIASITAGSLGYQSSQMLSNTSTFYQALFTNYASLVQGENDVQFIGTRIRTFIMDWRTPAVPRQNVQTEQTDLNSLTIQYDAIIHAYVQKDLLIEHPAQVAFFSQAGRNVQPQQQQILANNALHSWQTYLGVQSTILADLQAEKINDALVVQRGQGRADVAIAQEATQKLLQFDQTLVLSVQDIAALQQQHVFILTAAAIVFVFLAILVIGWLISLTLSPRLQELRRVAQSVNQGEFKVRSSISGQDEITEVAVAMNTMLDTTVGLLDETRLQRDALRRAAERLYSDMSLATRGVQINVSPNSDPIAMLSNAFSRTTGRFRHFVLHVNEMVDQTDTISRRMRDRSSALLQVAQKQELDQASMAFAQNMLALSDHLRSIAKEVQNDVASFQGEDASKPRY